MLGAAARGGVGEARGKRGGAARGWSIALFLVAGTLAGGDAAAHVTATGAIEGTAVAYRLTLVLSEVGEPAGRLLAAAADGEAASVEGVVGALRQRVTIRADGVPGGGLRSLLGIVTAFTLAHSATLALAVLGLVAIPGRLVESVIAASIAWVALENVAAREALSRRWLVSFGFGLVHGFGFATALTPLRLPPWNLAVALVGFNLGVEAGQAAAVAAALPLLAWMRRRPWEPRVVRALSLLLAALGAVWLVQRLFGV